MVPRSVYPDADWAVCVGNNYFRIGDVELVWQKCLRKLAAPDLVIIEQANRLLVNYLLLLRRSFTGLQVAYWGHGRNLQGDNDDNLRESVKRWLIKSVDWWFAYTRISAEVAADAGYPHERITVVENSIDTDAFGRAIAAVTRLQVDALRSRLALGDGFVALYCGGMYPDKCLPFLLEAVERMHNLIPNFNIVLIGSGPDAVLVEGAAARHSWIHYIGAVYGDERAAYFAMSDVMLMPGLVGLAIIDSFVAGLPIITTDIPIHSPEIAYLENGRNGLMTPYNVQEYVEAIYACFDDKKILKVLHDGCKESARHYTLDNMVNNYASGVLACLQR